MSRFARLFLSPLGAGALWACVAFLATAWALDAGGDYPRWPEGPGVTLDESFNVQQGVRLFVGGKAWLAGALSWRELFGEQEDLGPQAPFGYHLPDHPPLGRLWLGAWHDVIVAWFPPADHESPFVTTAARVGSAAAFALTVLLVGTAAARWYGPIAGHAAALALIVMPRVFGHAHLAALETAIGLASTAALLAVAGYWSGAEPPRPRVAIATGFLLGLALLTKIQAIFLPPAVILWALVRWKQRGMVPLLLWGLTGLAVLFIGWPWLWLDPVAHFQQYLGRTTQRVALPVWYLGAAFPDRDVPWHYPWVLFAITQPLPVLLFGLCGLFRCVPRGTSEAASPSDAALRAAAGARVDPIASLLLASLVTPLVVFSLPGVAVYDGARLFLTAFPIWAIFVGRGVVSIRERVVRIPSLAARSRLAERATSIASIFVLLGCGGNLVRMSPCFLSDYSAAVGGLRGAERLGMEPTYWGDSLTRSLLERTAETVPNGGMVDVAPVLHQFQLPDLLDQSPLLRRRHIRLRPLDPEQPGEFLLVFERKSALPPTWKELQKRYEPVATVEREGVRLAALYRRRPALP